MAAAIPTALKAADIARFAQRAGQLENAKPIVAYWCNYWIVHQILAKSLHSSDDESMTYTMHLMDKLEQSKADHQDNDAIVDDLAGQAYIEQFGAETFSRAENAMKLNKATRQTADTFLASATFLELCQIWGPLDPEVASKIKYAKFHSLRIVRAIKAGEDPNLSNPAPVQSQLPTDPDSDVLNDSSESKQHQSSAYQASVEDVPDEQDRLQPHLVQRSIVDQSLQPSRPSSTSQVPSQNTLDPYQSSSPNEAENYYDHHGHDHKVPPKPPQTNRDSPEGGGYFPRVSDPQNLDQASILPDIPSEDPGPPTAPDLPIASAMTPSNTLNPTNSHKPDPYRAPSLHSFPPPTMDQAPAPENSPAPFPAYSYQPSQTLRNPPHPAQPPPPPPQEQPSMQRNLPPHQPPSLPPANSPRTHPVAQTYLSDEEAILQAQKHARWAISALNFEDVKTAVKELRGALESLGAAP
ncbi:hypothetical protein MMC07_007601 [Pseudocyphellaria aurata]|nr:hypothetical protein [Pseudocyphellaria aurata]